MSVSHEYVCAYATAKNQRPDEVLSALRSGIDPAHVWQSFGRSGRVSEEEVLLAYLCKLEQRTIDQAWVQLAGEKTPEDGLRGMRSQEKPPRASRRSERGKQRPFKHPDSLQALSQLLARFAEKAWLDYCGENAVPRGWEEGISRIASFVPDRVGKLRALGNAIVPQVAADFIAAYMECQP